MQACFTKHACAPACCVLCVEEREELSPERSRPPSPKTGHWRPDWWRRSENPESSADQGCPAILFVACIRCCAEPPSNMCARPRKPFRCLISPALVHTVTEYRRSSLFLDSSRAIPKLIKPPHGPDPIEAWFVKVPPPPPSVPSQLRSRMWARTSAAECRPKIISNSQLVSPSLGA